MPFPHWPRDTEDEEKMSSTYPPRRELLEGCFSMSGSRDIEFVIMRADGRLKIGGISQINSHAAREMHKKRRRNAETLLRGRYSRPGKIQFGTEFDALRCLPQLPFESQKPGILNEVKHTVFRVFGQERMNEFIWPTGTHNVTLFTGMLLISSTHLDGMNSGKISNITTAIKLEAMRQVREKIQLQTQDSLIGCVSAAACLGICALVRGGKEGAEEYRMHRQATAALLAEAKRSQLTERSKCCNNVVRVISIVFLARRCHMPLHGLAPPILNIAAALEEFGPILEDPIRPRLGPSPELYSPVYDGRADPEEPPFPFVKTQRLRILLQVMQSIVKICIGRQDSELGHVAHATVLNYLCQRILDMPSSTRLNSRQSRDHIYEACRLTSVLLARSLMTGRSWQAIAHECTLTPDFMHALHASDTGSLWGKNFGLLYWVMLVFHCAAFGTAQYPYLHALLTRIYFELTYAHDDWHGAIFPMIALKSLMPLEQIS